MITQAELKAFAKTNSWNTKHNSGQGLDGPDNYSGPAYGDMVVVLGRSRDSEILEESNFEAALERLDGKSKNVTVERFGHWACGWFELIMVDPKSKKHLRIACEIAKDMEHYPVLNESDYSEREFQYQSDYANGAKKELAVALSKHFGVKVSNVLKNIAYELNMEVQGYSGNDSCINIYSSRTPDDKDLKELKRSLQEISYQFKKSKVFKKLVDSVNVYRVSQK